MQITNPNSIITQKFILDLNCALSMENAGVKRLQSCIQEVSLTEVKQKLEHHIEESIQHQERLQQLISQLGGTSTNMESGLPLPSYPEEMKGKMQNSIRKQEWELKKAEEDMIIESAEVSTYLMLTEITNGRMSLFKCY